MPAKLTDTYLRRYINRKYGFLKKEAVEGILDQVFMNLYFSRLQKQLKKKGKRYCHGCNKIHDIDKFYIKLPSFCKKCMIEKNKEKNAENKYTRSYFKQKIYSNGIKSIYITDEMIEQIEAEHVLCNHNKSLNEKGLFICLYCLNIYPLEESASTHKCIHCYNKKKYLKKYPNKSEDEYNKRIHIKRIRNYLKELNLKWCKECRYIRDILHFSRGRKTCEYCISKKKHSSCINLDDTYIKGVITGNTGLSFLEITPKMVEDKRNEIKQIRRKRND